VFVNDAFNSAGSSANASPVILNLSSLQNGTYTIIIEAYDEVGRYTNSSARTIYIDTVQPYIELSMPMHNANITTNSYLFNFTVYDNLAGGTPDTGFMSCTIVLDGSIYELVNATNASVQNVTVLGLSEGLHYWNVTCIDPALNTNTSETRNFNMFSVPIIDLISPLNASWIRVASYDFIFNVSDDTGIENCSLIIDGSINSTKSNAQIILNGTNNLTGSQLNGVHTWAIECYDNTTFKTYSITETRIIYADLFNPVPVISTANSSWFRTSAPQMAFNITDNMDDVLNYTFFVNDSINANGTALNATPSNTNLFGLQNGTYFVLLEGKDEAGNIANTSAIQIFIDTVRPSIALNYPPNNTNYSVQTIDLNFTPSDNLADLLMCNVTVDGVNVAQEMNISNGVEQNITLVNIVGGYHYWNVTCVDLAGNYNVSETRRFYITRPDIYVNSSNLIVSNLDLRENETVNVSAIIENIGTSDSGNFIVQFWANYPGLGGTQIGTDFNIALTAGDSINLSVNFTVPIGTTEVFVLADTPIISNGVIQEENESNNVASVNVTVSLWHFAYGTTGDNLVMNDAIYKLLFDWWVDNSTGSNIMAIDSDSSINWRQLASLGRNISNDSVSGDFEDLDIRLSSVNFSDSINRTYVATGSGAPKETLTYNVYNRVINNVPVANSTNNSNFKTGILWDYSDGGFEYDGTQDVVFITSVNKGASGYGGFNDFEIRVPATLREYTGANDQSVDFYMEIR
jgi:hypothetical protein